MSTEQPDALRLATILGNEFDTYTDTWSAKEAAAELRRLHAEIETLRAGYSAARLEIESLKAQLASIGAGGVEPLRKRECLHQISEPAPSASIEQEAMQMLWNDQQQEEKEHYRNVARGAERHK